MKMIKQNKSECLKGDIYNNRICPIDYCEYQELMQKCEMRKSKDENYYSDLTRLKEMTKQALLWELNL